ncbi:SDR family oxidoreductase [Porphyrobacter sp. ULC335]|uniref:SDR family oxidoreductase n=1 Tax=Porphyrobacter sp. ULC335 TaxID=2854260 RepID=UPI002220A244|nr:SDR family oxidoreductase [Porphyrobacter sp. ULC335]UYV15749.1 SDR family oxidoreductase [Porphyrobacter sp. ULC335]
MSKSHSPTIVPKLEEGDLPGLEANLKPKPDWEPRYPGSGRLDRKVAIVTGGDSGIGRAVAVLFAREGANVVISYLEEEEDALATAEMVEDEGAHAVTIAGDIGDRDHCREIIDLAIRKFGKIDILVNNAGEQHPDKDVTEISRKQLKRTFQTNVYGMFYLVQAAMPYLGRGAAIINCTSVTMYQGAAELLDYSATKGAITAFTRSLSQNLAEQGIRVNGVAPGPIWTPLNPMGGASKDKLAHFGESTPMGRRGQPNEVAPCFLFLACEDSSYMTGQVLHPNGGTIVGS